MRQKFWCGPDCDWRWFLHSLHIDTGLLNNFVDVSIWVRFRRFRLYRVISFFIFIERSWWIFYQATIKISEFRLLWSIDSNTVIRTFTDGRVIHILWLHLYCFIFMRALYIFYIRTGILYNLRIVLFISFRVRFG